MILSSWLVSIESITKNLDHDKIVRAMPIHRRKWDLGLLLSVLPEEMSYESISVVDTLLETTGKSIFMKNEDQLDAVTSLIW